jgi:hypothetical protein
MTTAVEYQGYQVVVNVSEETWGFASGQWRGSFRFWQEGKTERFGAISRTEKSAYDAKQKALRVAMSVIDAEIAREGRTIDRRYDVLARH